MTGVRLTVPNSFTFMVARKGRTVRPGVTLPRTRYQTLDEAASEAEAQAAASPGQVMIVFQEVLRVKLDPCAKAADMQFRIEGAKAGVDMQSFPKAGQSMRRSKP